MSTFVCVCVCSSHAPYRRPRIPQARTVVQQCNTAKVKIKPALEATEAEWAEVGVAVLHMSHLSLFIQKISGLVHWPDCTESLVR